MRRVLFSVLLAGCLQPPEPPAPTQIHVAKQPVAVVTIATRELTLAGFEIAVSDANAGTLVAKRTKTPDDDADVTCEYRHGSAFSRLAQTTLTINLAARSDSGGSSVVVNSRVHADLSNLPTTPLGKPASNDKDCVSAGTVEQRIITALR